LTQPNTKGVPLQKHSSKLPIEKASTEGLLQPISTRNIHHRVSLYADDVVLFLRPVAIDLKMVDALLRLFGTSSGLRTNI